MIGAKQARIDSLAHNEKVKKVINDLGKFIEEAVEKGEYAVRAEFSYAEIGGYESVVVRYFKELKYDCSYSTTIGCGRSFNVNWR